MKTKTLSLWGNGAITLPKEWRDQFPTRHFLAETTPKGLLIKPILHEKKQAKVEYWEKRDGSFGLHFPEGIDAAEFLDRLQKAEKKIEQMGKRRRLKKS